MKYERMKTSEKYSLSFYLIMIVIAVVLANETARSQSKVGSLPVRSKMQNILLNIQELRPYMEDDDKFRDLKNQGFITNHLKDLSQLIKEAKHNQELKTPALSVSRQVLEDHFKEIERVFRVGNKSYARWQLNTTLPICMSCHTQMPANSVSWQYFDSKAYRDDFEHAEFLFAGRDFDGALRLYDKIIDNFPDNKIKVQNVETALERKMAIFARIKRDFKAGVESVSRSQGNKNMPEYLRRNLVAWKEIFQLQQNRKIPNPKTAKDLEIRSYVENEFKRGLWDKMVDAIDARLVTNLTVSGVLYEYLNLHPNTEMKPDILLWLAQCDRDLNNNFFFSLADLYLKKCMAEFPTHPVGKKCYREYESSIYLSYTGSSGTSFPREVEKELRDLRLKIFGSAKEIPKGN